MKKITLTLLIPAFAACAALAQNLSVSMQYEPSAAHPYGQLNPKAPPEVADFAGMIGTCDCNSTNRNPDGTWQESLDMVWRFKYIMNGTAIQDEVWRAGDFYAGSMRQYQPDSAAWVVTYFSYPAVSTKPGVWLGNKTGDNIVLKAPQNAPNGMSGIARLTFYDISENGYKWIGEWVDDAGTIVYPFWKITCVKREE